MKTTHITIFALAALLLAGCTKDEEVTEGTLRLSTRSLFNGSSFAVGDTIQDPAGNPMIVEQFRMYISEAHAIKENNETVRLVDVDQINFAEGWTQSYTLPAGKYKGIQMSIGVPEDLNTDQDPAQYPTDHPLSISSAEGMFWTWNSGYIFVKYEGKVALDGDENNILDPYAFHVGADNFYRTITLNRSFEIGEPRADLRVNFNAEQFLTGADDTIDLAEDNLTHTMDNMPLANRFITLFSDGITLN